MARDVSVQCRDVLDGGAYSIDWVADLIYDGSPRAQNVPITEPRFSWDASAQIQGRGSCTLVWADLFGQSIVPREIGDMLSPFGVEVQADVMINAGDFSERVPMGRFVLDRVPSSVEYAVQNPQGGLPVVVESTLGLDLKDYFLRISGDGFAFPTSPKSPSMWDEAQLLTGLPLFRSIPDRVLATNLTYEDDRLDALEKVFGPANAWPALTPSGALTAMPKTWTAPVGTLDNVLDTSVEMRSENVYNRVVIEGKNPDPDGEPLRAVAEIADGFLRTKNRNGSRSPFGGKTYRESSDFLTTQEMCDQFAIQTLARVSRMRSITRRVVEPFNPLRELGDVLVFTDPTRRGETSLVRVRSIDHVEATTTLEVEVSE